jgi:hypothetical protein
MTATPGDLVLLVADEGMKFAVDGLLSRPLRLGIRESLKPLSSAIFGELARVVNVEGCIDPSFQKFVRVLREWFPKSRS